MEGLDGKIRGMDDNLLTLLGLLVMIIIMFVCSIVNVSDNNNQGDNDSNK